MSGSIRLSSRGAVVGILTDTHVSDVRSGAQRLGQLYAGVPGLEPWTASWTWLPSLQVGVTVAAAASYEICAPLTLVWGCPIGRSGVASDMEIAHVLEHPADAAAL